MTVNKGLCVVLSLFAVSLCKGNSQSVHFTCIEESIEKFDVPPKDCSELPTGSISGVYTIAPNESHPYSVYCDMDTDGGGWTVFQRRRDGSVNFYLNWTTYEEGFGPVSGEHWLGNAKIAYLTEQKNYSLRVDMEDFENTSKYALYDAFRVIANKDYELQIQGHQGEAGDAMTYCHGARFSTKDRDNDRKNGSCAVENEGAWWYKKCHRANLNGRYIPEGHYTSGNSVSFPGVEWAPRDGWKGRGYSLMFTEMKLRPIY